MTRKATKYFIIRRSSSEAGTSSDTKTVDSSNYSKTTTTPQYDGPPRLATTSDYNKDGGAKLNIQKILNKERVIRTKRGTYEIAESPAWGSILVPVEDPDAFEVTAQDLESAKLVENFPKIPPELWSRWVDLCFHFCFNRESKTETKTETSAIPAETSDVNEYTMIDGVKKKWNTELQMYQVCEQQDSVTSVKKFEATQANQTARLPLVSPEYEAIKFTKINGQIHRYGHEKASNSWKFLDIINLATETVEVSSGLATPTGEQKASRGFWHDMEGGGEYSTSPYAARGHTTSYSSPELEVSCLLLRKINDLTQWRILIPTQNVTRGSVNATFDKCCDLVTGEELTQFPPPGWAHAGSSHSHNTMGAFFSSTDDSNELGVPGLHIVLGSLYKYDKSYKVKASLVLRQNRRIIDINSVVDTTPQDNRFHPNVLNYISYGGSSQSPSSTSTKEETPKKAPEPTMGEKVKGAVKSLLGSLIEGATGAPPEESKNKDGDKDEDDPFNFVGI